MACTTESKFVEHLRFLASGQDDPQSAALTKAADEIGHLLSALKGMSKLCDETHAAEQSALSEVERLCDALQQIADMQTSEEDGVNKALLILARSKARKALGEKDDA